MRLSGIRGCRLLGVAVAAALCLRAELTERLARAMLAGSDSSPYPTALA
jgi:hypothetical protein